MTRLSVISVTMLLLGGCNQAATPTAGSPTTNIQTVELRQATFYLAGMNARLKIL